MSSTESPGPSALQVDDDEDTVVEEEEEEDTKWLNLNGSPPSPPPRVRRVDSKKMEDETSETGGST